VLASGPRSGFWGLAAPVGVLRRHLEDAIFSVRIEDELRIAVGERHRLSRKQGSSKLQVPVGDQVGAFPLIETNVPRSGSLIANRYPPRAVASCPIARVAVVDGPPELAEHDVR